MALKIKYGKIWKMGKANAKAAKSLAQMVTKILAHSAKRMISYSLLIRLANVLHAGVKLMRLMMSVNWKLIDT